MVYFTVECGNPNPHKAHSWREGFLWHRKRECKGCPEKKDWLSDIVVEYCKADVEATAAFYEAMFTHRHNYMYMSTLSDSVLMVWHCKGCGDQYSRFRSLFTFQTRERRVLNDGYSVFINRDFMRSWP